MYYEEMKTLITIQILHLENCIVIYIKNKNVDRASGFLKQKEIKFDTFIKISSYTI